MMKIWPFILIFILGCATPKAPTGGLRDKIAPKILKATPENSGTHFSNSSFEIVFDEFFKLGSPRKTVIISPPIDPFPEFLVKGKTLLVSWSEPLEENTTYNFYFAGAISDNNEGNDTSFSYVFSTGNSIDSLTINANVRDAYTLKPKEDIWLVGYKGSKEEVLMEQPDFISKVNKNGTGRLSYLPNTPLWIYALKDNNFNLKYDAGIDELAFLSEKVDPNETETMLLNLSTSEDTSVQLVSNVYIDPGKVRLVFNTEMNAAALFGNDASDMNKRQKDNDTLMYYFDGGNLLKGRYTFPVYYTDKPDTVQFYVGKDIEETYVQPKFLGRYDISANKPLRIGTSSPIVNFNRSLITVLRDSMPIDFDLEIDEDVSSQLNVLADFKPGLTYNIRCDKGAIKGEFKVISDSLIFAVNTRELDYYALLKVETDYSSGLFQLLKDGKVVSEFKTTETKLSEKYDQLEPGKYSLRLVKDLNQDGKWTTGDYLKNRQPEEVVYYPDLIELRSGWDEEIEWLIPKD